MQPAAPPAPTEASLRDAALRHLARFAATEAGVRRVLRRRVDAWARAAEAAGAPGVAEAAAAARVLAGRVAAAMVAIGAVDDAAFAEARARRLSRAGQSRRAIAAHLNARGVAAETAAAALPETELEAALALCRRRRIGPFGGPPMEGPARLKALAALARAGFGRAVAEAALGMPAEAAEARLLAFRR